MREGLAFLREFLRSPGTVGSVWPSSPALAACMIRMGRVASARAVVELGPGTGALTRAVLGALPEKAAFLALERNERLAGALANSLAGWSRGRSGPARVVTGCATRLRDHVEAAGFPRPDAVLSGLPWAAFDAALQEEILSEIAGILPPAGVFVTFAYFGPHLLARGRSFRRRLEARFGSVETSPVVLANLPPAFVLRAAGRARQREGAASGRPRGNARRQWRPCSPSPPP